MYIRQAKGSSPSKRTRLVGAAKPHSPIKDTHIRVCLNHDVESKTSSGLEQKALLAGFPRFSSHQIDTSREFLGKGLELPLLISPLTGGGRQSERINRNLATAAKELGIGMAVGSQKPMLEGKARPDSYLVRKYAPSIPLLANLGLAHAKKGREYILRAIESIGADGIILYVNPLQEILQEGGEADYTGILESLDEMLEGFPYPVLLKEVGFGFPDDLLAWAGVHAVAGVDVAGLGGTNWGKVEGIISRRDYRVYEPLGRKTVAALQAATRYLRDDQYVIASGGIRTGLDMAKALALGASFVSMGLPFLKWANVSVKAILRGVAQIKEELRVAMWYTGSKEIIALKGKVEADAM
jgi:isopentenyl-diphosphate Delta-isomerase